MQTPKTMPTLDLGTFDGYNLEHDKAIINISAADLILYDHELSGEAEFWPSGDNVGVKLVFEELSIKNRVTGEMLLDLKRIILEMGGPSLTNYAILHHAIHYNGETLETILASELLDLNLHVFHNEKFESKRELETRAAYELLELYYPKYFEIMNNPIAGISFDAKHFLNCGLFGISIIKISDELTILVVEPR